MENPQTEKCIRKLATVALIMFAWLLIWALVLKMGSEIMLVRNYNNLKEMTVKERIMWDIIPFNYRGEPYWKMRQFIETILNCFVLAPLAILLCYLFKKPNVWRNVALCLAFSLGIELLQLCTVLGNPATEDLITNTVSGFIGYAIYQLLLRRIPTKLTARLFIVVDVILVAAVVFSLVTTAIAADTIFAILTKTL